MSHFFQPRLNYPSDVFQLARINYSQSHIRSKYQTKKIKVLTNSRSHLLYDYGDYLGLIFINMCICCKVTRSGI